MPFDNAAALPAHWQAPGLHAGFWRRVVAWFIDALVLSALHWSLLLFMAPWLLVPWFLPFAYHSAAAWRFVGDGLQPFGIIVGWLYYALCEMSVWQATPGKLALGLQVTDERGDRIGFGRASGRYFGKYVSLLICGIGFLMAGWTARKQALHDLMAGCCVVRKEGLAAWRNGQPDTGGGPSAGDVGAPAAAMAARSGMPGWAVTLIVLGALLFAVVPAGAIVAAIAIPVYQNYMVRSEVQQGIDASARARALVGEYIGARGELPADNAALGLPRPDAMRARYVTSVRVAGGKVVVTYGNQANRGIRGGHVVMSPVGNAALLHWHCVSPDIRGWYLPRSCRD